MPIIERYDEVVNPESGVAPQAWLLPFRSVFRDILMRDVWSRFDLEYLLRSGDPRLRAIIIMLLGKCASRRNLRGVERHGQSPNPSVRKQVAKALRRLEAEGELQRMASAWPADEWVQRFARQRSVVEFSERLSRFVSHNVDASQSAGGDGDSPMAYWARDRRWYLSPPKGAWYIRRILQRIHRWVRSPRPH